MLFNDVERIDRNIFNFGKFNVLNTILLGSKGKETNRLNPIYKRNYDSKKYVDRLKLSNVNIKSGEFIVFAYHDYESKTNEEIFVSYPHLKEVGSFFTKVMKMLSIKGLIVKGNISPECKDYVVTSDTLGGNKKLAAVPHVIVSQDGNSYKRGIILMLNDETVYTELDYDTCSLLYKFFKDLRMSDLIAMSNQVMILAGLFELPSQSSNSEGGDDDFLPSRGRNTFSNRFSSRNIFGGKSKSTNTIEEETLEEPIDDIEDIIEDEEGLPDEEFETVKQDKPKKSVKKPVNKKKAKEEPINTEESNNGLSFDDILAGAEEVELGDLNLEDEEV